MDYFDRILKLIDFLPPFPAVVTKALALMKDPDVDLNEIAEVIKFDESISANLLRLCNSSYVGLKRPMLNVRDAVMYLGINRVNKMLLITGARSYYLKQKPGYEAKAGELWSHSLATSFISTRLEPFFPSVDSDTVFITSLLHDVGKIVLSEFVENEHELICETIDRELITFFEAESKVIGYDHADIGYRILKLWRFPDDVSEAVKNHHAPVKNDDPPLTNIVRLSDILARKIGYGREFVTFEQRRYVDLCNRTGISPEMLDSISGEMIGEIKRIEAEYGYAEVC